MNSFSRLFKHILLSLTLTPLVSIANINPSPLTAPQYAVGLDVGVATPSNLGKSTTFPLGYSTFSYKPKTHDVNALFSGISISTLLAIAPLYNLQVGLSAHHISKMKVKGNLEQGISPPFYQSTYSYRVTSSQYLVDAKLSREFCNYSPYVYVGLGVASNRTYGYSDPVPDYLTVTTLYRNRTTHPFTYSLGLGIDYFVFPKLSVGIGYRFINLGKTGLGEGVIRTNYVSAQLTQSPVYVNTFLAQLNFFV